MSAGIKLSTDDVRHLRDRFHDRHAITASFDDYTALLDLAEEALRLRALVSRARDGLRRYAKNEALSVDFLRGAMLGMADGMEDQCP